MPLVSSPHGEVRKWYPLLVPRRQAEKSGESNAPPATPTYSYVYDRFGNRWQQNGSHSMLATFTGNNPGNPQNNNRMDSFSYDTAGNMLSDGTHTYTYDAENRLISVDNGTTATYLYDADGHRIHRSGYTVDTCDSSGKRDYIYDLSGRAFVENTFSGGTGCKAEVYAGGRHLATQVGGGTYFDHADWLGTSRLRNTYAYPTSFQTCTSLPFGDALTCSSTYDYNLHFTDKERDFESGLDNFGARYYGSSLGRFMTPDPAGVAFSMPSAPQSWNLYSYVQNNPLNFTDPDGRECVWDDGSFDSKDDASTGTYSQCSGAGGHYFDPATFTAGGGQDWSSGPNADLAAFVGRGDETGPTPDISQASSANTSTTGQTTTINFAGPNWFGTQTRFGNHPFRDNNPGDIEFGRFARNHGAIGSDGRFSVFLTSSAGGNALDALLNDANHNPAYINMSIDDAVGAYAPDFENNTAGYQQFLQNVVGVGGNTPLSSLTPAQFTALENGIARYEGFYAPGGYSVTATSMIGTPHQ